MFILTRVKRACVCVHHFALPSYLHCPQNTHRYTHIQSLMCPDSAFIEPVSVHKPTSWPVQPQDISMVVFHSCLEAQAFHCNIFGGRCESVTTASCAHTHRHKMMLVTTHNNVTHRKREQHHNASTNNMLQLGSSLISVSRCVLQGGGLWRLSQLSLGSLIQLLQLHINPNLNPTSLTAACVLTSVSRRPRSSEQRIRSSAETSHGH